MNNKHGSLYSKYNTVKNDIVAYFWQLNKFDGYIMRQLITLKTVKKLINGTRTPKVIDLAELLGIKIYDYKIPHKETTTLNKILKVFKNENIIVQYQIGSYKIDLYFVDYKLAIECDEFGHSDRNNSYENKRQKYIEDNLDATVMRFNPDNPQFDILDVISDIHYYIADFYN